MAHENQNTPAKSLFVDCVLRSEIFLIAYLQNVQFLRPFQFAHVYSLTTLTAGNNGTIFWTLGVKCPSDSYRSTYSFRLSDNGQPKWRPLRTFHHSYGIPYIHNVTSIHREFITTSVESRIHVCMEVVFLYLANFVTRRHHQ